MWPAVLQAALLGLCGIAFSSLVVGDEPDMSGLEPYVARVLELVLPQTQLRLVNVNLPPQPRGISWTRQAVEKYDGKVVPGEDPLGRRHFWFTVVPLERHQPGTDLWAMAQDYISITPLRLDLTDHEHLARVAGGPTIEFDTEREPAIR